MTHLEPIDPTTEQPLENGQVTAITEALSVPEDEAALRSLIFQKQDIKEKLVTVPEWGVQILVRALNGNERAELIAAMQSGGLDLKKVYPDLVTMTARHPTTRKLIFKPADRAEIMKKAGSAVERLAINAAELSGLTEEALNDMRKN